MEALPRRPVLTSENLSDIAEEVPRLRGLPGVHPWDVDALDEAVAALGDPCLTGALLVLAAVDMRLQR